MAWKVDVKGMKDLEKEMDRVVNEMKDSLEMGTEEAAESTVSRIKGNAPGSLKRAVTTKKLPERPNMPQVTMVGLLWQGFQHQHLVEFGTGPRYYQGAYRGQMPADGFFRRSIDQSEGMIKNTIRNHAQDPINRR